MMKIAGKGYLAWYSMVTASLLLSSILDECRGSNTKIVVLKSVAPNEKIDEQDCVKKFVTQALNELKGAEEEKESMITTEETLGGKHGMIWRKGGEVGGTNILLVVDFFDSKQLKKVMEEILAEMWRDLESHKPAVNDELRGVWGVVGESDEMHVKVGVYFTSGMDIPFRSEDLYEKTIKVEYGSKSREDVGKLKEVIIKKGRSNLQRSCNGLGLGMEKGDMSKRCNALIEKVSKECIDLSDYPWNSEYHDYVHFPSAVGGKREVDGPFISLTQYILKAMCFALCEALKQNNNLDIHQARLLEVIIHDHIEIGF